MSDPEPDSAAHELKSAAPEPGSAAHESELAAQAADLAAHEAAVDATRRVVAHLRKTRAPAALLSEAREVLDALADRLAPHDHPGPYAQGALDPVEGSFDFDSQDPMVFFPYSPIIGRRNPIAPPIHFEVRDGVVLAEPLFDAPWTGPPGGVHGGVIALLFDELLGTVNVVNGVGGFTGTLTVRYRALTPIGRTLRARAWVDRSEGRKTFTRGTLHHGDLLCAEAEGVFVAPGQRGVQQLHENIAGAR